MEWRGPQAWVARRTRPRRLSKRCERGRFSALYYSSFSNFSTLSLFSLFLFVSFLFLSESVPFPLRFTCVSQKESCRRLRQTLLQPGAVSRPSRPSRIPRRSLKSKDVSDLPDGNKTETSIASWQEKRVLEICEPLFHDASWQKSCVRRRWWLCLTRKRRPRAGRAGRAGRVGMQVVRARRARRSRSARRGRARSGPWLLGSFDSFRTQRRRCGHTGHTREFTSKASSLHSVALCCTLLHSVSSLQSRVVPSEPWRSECRPGSRALPAMRDGRLAG